MAEKQILVKLPEDVHAALVSLAKAEGRSMHMQARHLIVEGTRVEVKLAKHARGIVPLPAPAPSRTDVTPNFGNKVKP